MILREAVGVAEGVGVSVTLQKVPRWCASQTQGPGLAGHVPWAPQEQHVVAGPTPSQQTSLQNAHSPAGLRGHRHSNGRAAAVLAAHRDVLGALRPGLPVQAGGGVGPHRHTNSFGTEGGGRKISTKERDGASGEEKQGWEAPPCTLHPTEGFSGFRSSPDRAPVHPTGHTHSDTALAVTAQRPPL